MEENYIKYKINTGCNLSIDPIEFIINEEYIKKISLRVESERELSMIVFLQNVEYEQGILEKIKPYLNKIIDKISYNFNLQMGEPYFISSNINERKDGASYCSCIMHIPQSPQPQEIEKLKKDLSKNIRKDYLLTLYRGIMQCTDNVAKYMLLYSLLAELKGPGQYKIDKYIKRKEPTVEELNTTNPHRQGEKETVYTYYRNQIGHTNENSDVKKIRSFIDSNIVKFMNIVKSAIEENIR